MPDIAELLGVRNTGWCGRPPKSQPRDRSVVTTHITTKGQVSSHDGIETGLSTGPASFNPFMLVWMESIQSDSANDRSFQLDNRVKSFRLYPPIRWKDLPLNLLLLVLVLLLLTGFNFAASKLLGFLNREALLVLIGLCVGFQLAIWILRYRNHFRSSSKR
jgi:hypothetical protein